jgi:hypothetical protein
MFLNQYIVDEVSWNEFAKKRCIVGKYVLPKVLMFEKKKLVVFAKNDYVMSIFIDGTNLNKMIFNCSVFNTKNICEKTRYLSGYITDTDSQHKIEILLEKYFLVNEGI